MPVQSTDSPAVETGAVSTLAAAALEAIAEPQLSSKAFKRKLVDLQTTEPVADSHAETADTAATGPATRKRHAAVTAAQQALNGARAPAEHVESRPDEQSQQQSGGSDEQSEEGSQESEGDDGPGSHPYGVQPWGNFYLTHVPEVRTAGELWLQLQSTLM
jgi:hypothetical protein